MLRIEKQLIPNIDDYFIYNTQNYILICCQHSYIIAPDNNDSLHKYSSTTKLNPHDAMKRWSLLNNEWGSQRDIYGSNALIYALLMTRIPAPYS